MGYLKNGILFILFCFILTAAYAAERDEFDDYRRLISYSRIGTPQSENFCYHKTVRIETGKNYCLNLDIPWEGNYQLYINIYNDWKKYTPHLAIDLSDSKENRYTTEIIPERIWYHLGRGQEGRWMIYSPSAVPFWHLDKGPCKLKLTLSAIKSCWKKKKVLHKKDNIYISEILFVPVADMSKTNFFSAFIEAETFTGEWQATTYSKKYELGIADSQYPNTAIRRKIFIPESGKYVGLIKIMKSPQPQKLYLSIRQKERIDSSTVELSDKSQQIWQFYWTKPVFMSAGPAEIKFESGSFLKKGYVAIDYLIFMPISSQNEKELL